MTCTRRDVRLVLLYVNQVAETRDVVECPVVDASTYIMVGGCYLIYLILFLNIHVSAIINADTDSLENG